MVNHFLFLGGEEFKCIIYITFFILTCLIVTYYCVGVYVLANDYDRFKMVETSCTTKIWYYVLLCLFVNFDKVMFRKYYIEEKNFKNHVAITFLELSMLTFGGIEIFRNQTCIEENDNNFFYTDLWKFALANFIFQIITSLFFVINITNYKCEKKNRISFSNTDYDDIHNINLRQDSNNEERWQNMTIV